MSSEFRYPFHVDARSVKASIMFDSKPRRDVPLRYSCLPRFTVHASVASTHPGLKNRRPIYERAERLSHTRIGWPHIFDEHYRWIERKKVLQTYNRKLWPPADKSVESLPSPGVICRFKLWLIPEKLERIIAKWYFHSTNTSIVSIFWLNFCRPNPKYYKLITIRYISGPITNIKLRYFP